MRSQPLDLLRAVAVFLVLGRHLPVCPARVNFPLHLVTAVWQRGGWIGVDLFFVLSGFLVSGLLFKEHLSTGKVAIGRFLLRRGFKIYPSFYLLILVTVLFKHSDVTLAKFLAEIFFVQNYFRGMWGHTWSLAVEEHFYLLLTFAIGFLPLLRKSIPVLLVALALLCLALRIYTAMTPPYSDERNQFPTHLRLDSLGFGVLLAYLKYFRPNLFLRLQHKWLIVPGLALLLPAFVFVLGDTPFMYTVGLSLSYLGSGMVLLAMVNRQLYPGFIFRPLAALGARSYSLYLWHLPVSLVAARFANWYAYAAVYLVGAVVVGVAMNYVVETPMLKVRDYFYPAKSSLAGPVADPV